MVDLSIPLPLEGLTGIASAETIAEQLTLFGDYHPIRVPAELWRGWLADPEVVERFEAKRYRRGDDDCWPWLGAVSSTGHGSGWTDVDDEATTVCHRCDSHGCSNPDHMRLGTAGENRAEWAQRHRDPGGPLADLRGPAGRTRAIATTIREGIGLGETYDQIENRILIAEGEGLPLTLWRPRREPRPTLHRVTRTRGEDEQMDTATGTAIISALISAGAAGIATWQTTIAKDQAAVARASAAAAERQATAAEAQVSVMKDQLAADEAARLQERRPHFQVPAGFVRWEDNNFPRGRLVIEQTSGASLQDVAVRATGEYVSGLRGKATYQGGFAQYDTVDHLELGPMSIGTEAEIHIELVWSHVTPIRVELELTSTTRDGGRTWIDHIVTALDDEPEDVKAARDKRQRGW